MAELQQLTYMAKLAEQTERFDDMIAYMKRIIEINTDLNDEERNLFSIAYKNQVGPIRTALRAIHTYEVKETQNGHHQLDVIKYYNQNLKKDLFDNCNECLQIINQIVSSGNSTQNHEAYIFYQKMKGDYLRYLAEFSFNEQERIKTIQDAGFAYMQALDKSKEYLKATHQLRLGVALNFSVFYYEIVQDIHKAIQTSKTAFNEAIAELDNLCLFILFQEEESYKDTTTIMQLIKDNMTNWTQELQESGQEFIDNKN